MAARIAPSTLGRGATLLLLAAALAGCAVPVTGALEDDEANRVVVALEQSSLDATKEQDPQAEGKWRVLVQRDDVPRALSILRDEELPRSRPPGVLDAMGKGALVPSEAAEHAQLVAGLAGDLERTLEEIDGVLRARVHLSVPAPDPLRPGDAPTPRGSASVLIEHRGSTPPIGADAVARLVAGAVAGLLPADVTVVMIPRTAPALPPGGDIGHVGPFVVARTSIPGLQAGLVAFVVLVSAMAAAILVLYAKLGRARAETARAAKP